MRFTQRVKAFCRVISVSRLALCGMSSLVLAAQPHLAVANPTAKPVTAPVATLSARAGAPNVIVIMTDDVGFAASSTFGGEIPTRTMDYLADHGLSYSNFHTTGLCSPSRAALLTGRNHHAVGAGTVTDLARDLPGYTSIIPKNAGTLAQVLKANGYSTAAFGKNHNVPSWQSGPLGPFDQWASGLGFDHFYGFHGGYTDQFSPELIENNSMVTAPKRPDYILDRDLADRAVEWMRMQRVQSGGRPFFLYFAPGTAHTPLHAPAEWLERFRGKFDEGWDVYRTRAFERQKQLGLIPVDAKLAPLPDRVKPWDTLSADQKRAYARLMEAYAAALAFCDDQMGRLIEELRQNGELDNTLVIYVQGDNGATPEGGEHGLFNYADMATRTSLEETLAKLDDVGGPSSYPAAPLGWMMAMNTPFPYHKTVASRLGGIRNGMVISWPGKIAARGVRKQFTHLVDVMPTILELADIRPPDAVNGIRQKPFDGISFAYSLTKSEAPEAHRSQYFEIFGHAAFYQNGWFAASPIPAQGSSRTEAAADSQQWELYDLRIDSTQTVDLAARYPEKLRQMRKAFDAEARRNNVFPVSNDNPRYMRPGNRPEVTAMAGRHTFFPSSFRYSEGTFPSINNRSWSIEADVDIPALGGEGTLITQGGRFSGWGLVLLKGVPTFLYRTSETDASLTRLAAPTSLTPGRHRVQVSFAVDGPGIGKGGQLSMKVDGVPVAGGRLPRTVPFKFSLEDGAVGRDTGTALTREYEVPFAADGLRSVTVDLQPYQTGMQK